MNRYIDISNHDQNSSFAANPAIYSSSPATYSVVLMRVLKSVKALAEKFFSPFTFASPQSLMSFIKVFVAFKFTKFDNNYHQ